MRIWDLPPKDLCKHHLLGEHRELHALWVILTRGRRGYQNHPETNRWRGALRALYLRHCSLVQSMRDRGFVHRSPLDRTLAIGKARPRRLLISTEQQRRNLMKKTCPCYHGSR